jgi:hypothetical protein
VREAVRDLAEVWKPAEKIEFVAATSLLCPPTRAVDRRDAAEAVPWSQRSSLVGERQ